MASSPRRADQGGYTTTRDLKWSHAEKTIARRVFTRALEREFEVVIREAKEMAGKIEQPSDLWDLESFLTQSRKEIDRKYDYRYSVLTLVFGSLSEKAASERKSCMAWQTTRSHPSALTSIFGLTGTLRPEARQSCLN